MAVTFMTNDQWAIRKGYAQFLSHLFDAVEVNEPFTTPGDYTYDSDKIEVDGESRLVVGLNENSSFYANYNSDINGTYGLGVLTGIPTGGAVISGGKLDLKYSDQRYVSYDANLNADSQQTGCVYFKYTPNYSGSPGGDRTFFTISNSTISTANLIHLRHLSSGGIQLLLKDGGDVSQIVVDLGAWVPVLGTEYVFELNWDATTGATRLFIEGIQHGSTQTATFSRSTSINNLVVGSNYNGADSSNFEIDDFAYYTTVQHTINYTPTPYPIYSKDNSIITPNSGIEATEVYSWDSFTETSTKTGSDEIKHILSDDEGSTWMYWNGSAWITSDETYAQSNTGSEINTNFSSFPKTNNKCLPRSFIHSNDGLTTPALDNIKIDYKETGLKDGYLDNEEYPTALALDEWREDAYYEMIDYIPGTPDIAKYGKRLIKMEYNVVELYIDLEQGRETEDGRPTYVSREVLSDPQKERLSAYGSEYNKGVGS